MSHEIVKHHNDLNTIPMRNWSSEEMNFFFGIIAKMRDKGTKIVEFSDKELRGLADYSDWNLPRFKKIMENLGEHIASIRYYERTSNSFKIMNLFSTFEVNWDDNMSNLSVKVGVTENYSYIINKLDAEFTSYELAEFTQIRSTYAKTLYRLLKQWRTKGKREFSIDELKTLLDTPDYYAPSHIDKNILKPAMRELSAFFKNLKVKKVKANTRGTPVTGYIFTWQPEKTGKWINNKYQKRKTEKLPDWFGKEYADEKEIDTKTNDTLQKRLENLKNKRPKNK